MCKCATCHSNESVICQQCYDERVGFLLEKIEELQGEVTVLKTKNSFSRLALEHARIEKAKPIK